MAISRWFFYFVECSTIRRASPVYYVVSVRRTQLMGHLSLRPKFFKIQPTEIFQNPATKYLAKFLNLRWEIHDISGQISKLEAGNRKALASVSSRATLSNRTRLPNAGVSGLDLVLELLFAARAAQILFI